VKVEETRDDSKPVDLSWGGGGGGVGGGGERRNIYIIRVQFVMRAVFRPVNTTSKINGKT